MKPPTWFLDFKNHVLKFKVEMCTFQKQVLDRFDKIETDIQKMDTHRPTWFNQWVISDFEPLKNKVDSRLNKVIALNNLKE
jgi:uncharacterized iron-regulated protein